MLWCRRVKMTRLRARVAERLKGAQNTYAMLTTFNEIDMTNLMQLRTEFKVRNRQDPLPTHFMHGMAQLPCQPHLRGHHQMVIGFDPYAFPAAAGMRFSDSRL